MISTRMKNLHHRLTLWITFIITCGHLVLAVLFTRFGTMNSFRGMALSGCFLAFASWVGVDRKREVPLAFQTFPGLCLLGRVDWMRGVLFAP